MAQPKPHPPTLLLAAVFSRHDHAMDWAITAMQRQWGEVLVTSPDFDHSETSYYEGEMGPGLKKKFVVFAKPFDPQRLAAAKLFSNALEQRLANMRCYPEPRPVNIDPGYMTPMKLVLASAKDRAHRIYLSDGIFAEECLYYLDHRWQSRPWTYPDYQRSDFQDFFQIVRKHLPKTKP